MSVQCVTVVLERIRRAVPFPDPLASVFQREAQGCVALRQRVLRLDDRTDIRVGAREAQRAAVGVPFDDACPSETRQIASVAMAHALLRLVAIGSSAHQCNQGLARRFQIVC